MNARQHKTEHTYKYMYIYKPHNLLVPTSVHVLDRLLGVVRTVKVNVGKAPAQVGVDTVGGHVDRFDGAKHGENLANVLPETRHVKQNKYIY